MFDLTTISKGQIHLIVPQEERLSNARQLRMTAVCSEANVARLPSQLGHHASWYSVLPHNDLAERCIPESRSIGVDMSNMIRVPEGRVVLYFMEPGEPPTSPWITYDRLSAAFCEICVEDVDQDSVLNTQLVFVTGITTALTKATAKVTRHFVGATHGQSIDITLNVSCRGLLWSLKRAHRVLTGTASKSRIVFHSWKDTGIVFGIEGERAKASRQLREAFGTEYVVSTDGHNGVYYIGPGGLDGRRVDIVPVIGRPGAGDSFVATTLHDFLDGDVRQGINYGLRVSKYALTHHGDLTHITPSELVIPTTAGIIH